MYAVNSPNQESDQAPYCYTNRHGDGWYIHRRKQTSGRARFVMRMAKVGALRVVPEGYEIRENVHGKVSVRRHRTQQWTVFEAQLLRSALAHQRPVAYALDVDGATATVYASADDHKCFMQSLDAEFADGFADALDETLRSRFPPELVQMFRAQRCRPATGRPRYFPLLRFVIIDTRQRRFAVERVCFTGDRSWMRLDVMALSAAVLKYIPHLGRDSFFSLM